MSKAAFVLISHDRAFLTRLARATLWLDRSVVRRNEAGSRALEAWRDKIWAEEDDQLHKMDRKIKAEAVGRRRDSPPAAPAIKAGCGLCRPCGRNAPR